MHYKTLHDRLLECDDKSVEVLKSIYRDNCNSSDFVVSLLEIYQTETALHVQTTWLIKHHIDTKNTFNKHQTSLILSQLDKLSSWPSQLHILQIIPKLGLDALQLEMIEPTVRRFLHSPNKFVKASAFEAYFQIVECFPELTREFKLMCENAMRHESPAVRVKLKRILSDI